MLSTHCCRCATYVTIAAAITPTCTDIKNSNKKHINEALNRQLQAFLYGVLDGDNTRAAKKALAVLCELYRRGVWRDAKTVNVIGMALGCQRVVNPHTSTPPVHLDTLHTYMHIAHGNPMAHSGGALPQGRSGDAPSRQVFLGPGCRRGRRCVAAVSG